MPGFSNPVYTPQRYYPSCVRALTDPLGAPTQNLASVYGETVMSSKEAAARSRAAAPSEWKRRAAWLLGAIVVLAAAAWFRNHEPDRNAAAAPQPVAKESVEAPLPRVGRPEHDVMAIVNGQDISRQDLADACVRRYGEEVLESLVNKRLIANHCAKRGITVTEAEIAAEVDRMASRFQLGREQWLEMLQKERGISPNQYASDIVWPTLALRKLAGENIKPTAQEINQAYEREYGEMIRTRLIAVSDANQANQLHQQLATNPAGFARAAIEHSEDVNSASVGGLIQPIRRYMGDPAIEAAAFALQPGQVSSPVQVGNQFILLKCEARIPARAVPLAQVQEKIEEGIKDQKLRGTAHDLFASLQKTATIVNVLNDSRLSQTMPGVVATVNGDRIMRKELDQECVLRHGDEVLEGEITHLLLEQALKTARVNVTQADMDAEMRHAAELSGVVDAKGDADLAKWIETATTEQGITREQYLRDAVWPSAALKKLTASDVIVDETDLQKGYEANFGERVICRAIVLDNMRRAQEVWDKARRNPTVEFFGDLAAEYSIEPTSKALRGEVPPLGRHGGQPQLEEVAFNLQPGELSGIVQVEDKFVILRSEGRTKSQDLGMDDPDVREILQRDIYEKKLRLAMTQKFEEIRGNARVDNYLAGTSQAPVKAEDRGQVNVRQDTAVRPTSGVR
ncbi:MAG: peptidyl-prolyl cis-trans isomerase [Planctomycetales bacterium]|nr:peptidyl-prolyl cis-trans isomerase [Planctomycetales bacterium]